MPKRQITGALPNLADHNNPTLKTTLLGLWCFLFLSAASLVTAQSASPAPRSQPLLAPTDSNPHPFLFELMPANKTGIDFVYHWNTAPPYERLLNSSAVGGGVGVGDFDNDGLPDLCLTRPAGGPRLYRNLGGFRFTNVTDHAGIRADTAWSTGASFVDINNDGRLDLYVCCYDGPNRLFINQGQGTFLEQAKAYGLDYAGASMMIAFGDYDRDGRLDGYLLTGGLIPKPSQRFRVKFVDGKPTVPEELQEFWQLIYLPGERASLAEAGQFDRLFHNDGQNQFSDVSQTAGISGCDFGNAVVWWDYDDDGWPDLYIANDYFGPDRLYRNLGNGRFSEVSRTTLPHTPWTSMGADIADFNNDGWMDLIASDMCGTTHFKRTIDLGDMEKSGWFLDLPEPRQYMRNALFLNTGKDRFLQAAFLAGIDCTDWTWSIITGDLDHDGWVDVFVPNGMTRDWMDNDLAAQAKPLPPEEFTRFWRAQPVRADQNLAFKNTGDLQFLEVSQPWGLAHAGPTFGAALADLDGDGRLDLVVNNFEAPPRLYRNRERTGHRIKVQLIGKASNRQGVGATVRIRTGAGQQLRYVTLAHGFMSAGEPLAFFGLGQCDTIAELTVDWPSGQRQRFANLPADRCYTVEEPSGPASSPAPKAMTYQKPGLTPMFQPAELSPWTRPADVPTDDFKRQRLLPHQLSQFGPGLAWGDVDGDGVEELYLTGTRTQPGVVLRRAESGQFLPLTQTNFEAGVAEMAPLFFEANGDGFPDLYVAAGTYDCEVGDEVLRHRLYLNDGQGRFAPAREGALPDLRESSGPVAAADFDRDGDLDLFVGGRLIPGQYPLTPKSHLLLNADGRFQEVTAGRAPGLDQAGLVTSALWSDVDQDGWLDLLVACEWGPVRLYQNRAGRLEERTTEAGLASLLGWWNGLAGADVNHDGAIDLVVSNYGLNSPYQASPEEPGRLYFGDFEDQGQPQILEARLTRDGLLPRHGRTVLTSALPSLAARFPTHRDFALARLTNLFTAAQLQAALRREVNTLESGVLLNDGRGHFRFRPLPRLAQIAPGFGVALTEVDGDGHPDLYLVQNFSGPRRETGRLNGGVSVLLLGRGDGTFTPVWPESSGLVVPGDARGLTTADLNRDGWVDFVIGLNQGQRELMFFENHYPRTNRCLTVQLSGKQGNPTGIGSRVTVHLKNGSRQVSEVYAGAGFHSQGSRTLFFGLGKEGAIDRIEVRWPDGKSTVHTAAAPPAPQCLQLKQE